MDVSPAPRGRATRPLNRRRATAGGLGLACLLVATAATAAGPRLIVKFAQDDVEAAFAPLTRVAKLADATGIEAVHLRRMAAGAHLVQLPPGADARAAAAKAIAAGAVLAAPDRRLRAAKVVNDPVAVSSQFYLRDGAASISATTAWDITTGSPSVVVAVIDSGILPHPDLAGRLLPGYDFVASLIGSNDGNGRDADPTDPGDWIDQADLDSGNFPDCELDNSSWHGTSVAGVIGANSNNGLDIAGIDWAAKILPLRALGKCGEGDFSDIYDAIGWAAGLPVPGAPANPNPAQVINLSLGGTSDLTCTASENALFAGLLSADGTRAIVAAAGNDGENADLHFPSSCPAVISVAATSTTGNATSYTNTGPSVDLSAPGGNPSSFGAGPIPALSNAGLTLAAQPTVRGVQGTSFATPMVSGVIALMLSVAPDLSPEEVRSILLSSTKPFSASSTCNTAVCGSGILDARASVVAAQAAGGGGGTVAVVEYFHAGFGHYFVTGYPGEITALDTNPALSSAWARTGLSFQGYAGATAGAVTVQRFFTDNPVFNGRSSHFYTGLANEYDDLVAGTIWKYEGPGFYLPLPGPGGCAANHAPVYRMYNNGQGGAPNHRFTTSLAIYQDFTTTKNWIPEGIVFCSPP